MLQLCGAYHFLYLEHDVLQRPLQVGHLDGLCLAGARASHLERPHLAHGRRDVDEKHRDRVLDRLSQRQKAQGRNGRTPARSAGIVGAGDRLWRGEVDSNAATRWTRRVMCSEKRGRRNGQVVVAVEEQALAFVVSPSLDAEAA